VRLFRVHIVGAASRTHACPCRNGLSRGGVWRGVAGRPFGG
jgi:hypothetical protein